jgi:hypothetical protein
MQGLFPTGKIVGCRITLYAETLVAVRAPA